MLQKIFAIAAACLLILLWAASLPQVQARPLAQATTMLMQIDPTPTPMSMNGTPMPMDNMPMNGTAMPSGNMSNMPMGSGTINAQGGTIKIVAPVNGATINDASVMVRVETTNLTLGQDGVHFHLYVDGKVQGMSDGANTSIMAHDLTAGEHTLEVVPANGLHQEFNVSDMIKINVLPATAQTAASSADGSALLIIIIVAAIVIISGIGVVVSRRK
jgi:hypothetical protein